MHLFTSSVTRRRYCISLAFLCFLTSFVFSQSKWEFSPLSFTNNDKYKSIVYAKNTFIAINSDNQIVTSTDISKWNKSDFNTSRHLNAITYGNNTFVIAGDSGTILTSSNGINWIQKNIDSTYNLHTIAFGNNLFVAGSDATTFFTSNDGQAWSKIRPATSNFSINSLAFGNDTFMASSSDKWGTSFINYSSTDGQTWSSVQLSTDIYSMPLSKIAFINNKFIQWYNTGHAHIISPTNIPILQSLTI